MGAGLRFVIRSHLKFLAGKRALAFRGWTPAFAVETLALAIRVSRAT